jgi:hypothetical protein
MYFRSITVFDIFREPHESVLAGSIPEFMSHLSTESAGPIYFFVH